MNRTGKGIAFLSLVGAAVVLEVNGYQSDGVWLLIVLWAVFGEWN